MKAASQDDRALQRGLRRLLAQLVRQARRDLQRVPVHPKHAVHDLRTRMKKLPAILGLVKKHVPPRASSRNWAGWSAVSGR